MGAVDSCFDTAVAERFLATLIQGAVALRHPERRLGSRAELRSGILEYVEGSYNPTRLHSTLGDALPG
jgi:transposase InsO family protein